MQKNIIGVDLGATSGRVILARAGDDRLRMEELHRFPNRMREIDGRFYWDIHALYEEILRGLSVAGGRGERIDSIGIDTWGVDFACVDPDGDLLGLPRAYRDPYTDGVPEEFFRTVPRESVYAKTGIQVMNFNSLYQLYALNREHSPALAAAEHVLFMPDALSYLLGSVLFKRDNLQYLDNPIVEKINRAREMMRRHIGDNLPPEEIARRLNIGYTWFRRTFRAYVGIAPAQYQLQLRHNKARELLTTTDRTVSEIAAELGFENVSQFSAFFRQREKITATQYRSKYGF